MIMLRKTFFVEIKCDDKKTIFCGKDLNIISVSILWKHFQQKLSQI
jgi:hypothetical protein